MESMTLPESFYKEEIRSGYRVSAKMKKVWACELNLLGQFREVCEKHSLKFWIDSGTLLGAVRHGGFIPWDDDLDVVMLREDYDRLLSVADDEFKSPYIFQTAYNQRDFVRGHAQLRDSRTTAIIPCETGRRFNQGIFIDIFVLDFVPDDEKEYDRQYWKAKTRREHLEAVIWPVSWDRPKAALKQLYYKTLSLSKTWFNGLYGKYEDIVRFNKRDDCSCVSAAMWKYDARKRPAGFYDSTVMLDFEGIPCPAPAEYDKLLRIFFGDYMTPVQASSCHGELILDPDTPADETIRRLKKERKCKH